MSKQIELWIKTETGFWRVLSDLQEYDLDKSMARAEIINELRACIENNDPDKRKAVSACEKTWYWYSPQQENAMCDIAESNGRHCVRKTIRVRGINRPYTEITHTKKPWGYWPDYRLVTVRKGAD